MNSSNKILVRKPIAPPVYRPQPAPKVLQSKRAPGQPVAPPVYRPEVKKMAGSAQMKTGPVAPPVYRPQPVPKVLQTKGAIPVGPKQQGAIQRSRALNARPVGNVVQRDVDVKNALKTENGRYLIDPHDNSVLYSEVHSIPPKPRGLYQQTIDHAADSSHRVLFAWTPNVRFLSKPEHFAKPSASKPGHYEYTKKGFIDTTERFSVRSLGRRLESPPEVGVRPTLGVFGKNDCYAFGDSLQNLMVSSGETPLVPLGRRKKNVHVSNPDSPGDLTVEVGDMMRHIYKDHPHCTYHAATVVAQDGKSLVTLEGHVSKDLSKPEFMIRNGVVDFAQREVRAGYGDVVEITPLESLNPETVQDELGDFSRRYQRMMGADTDMGFQAATSNLGITFTDERERRQWAIRQRRRQLRLMRRQWLERRHARWDVAREAGRVSISTSSQGNPYITDEML
jgi:hypothetical protein